MQKTEMPHIYLDDLGRAWIDDTRTKVDLVVLDTNEYHLGPEEIREQHPHLTLGQIHAALAYYHDHKAEIDAQIEEDYREYQAMRAANPNPLTREQLLEKAKAKGITL
jgi:uncharacterized protein (DUF433 family)